MIQPTDKPTIPADKLCALTGKTDERHRQLARAGFFPKPVKGVYLLWPTIQGMFKYLWNKDGDGDESLHALKVRIKKAEAERRERDNKLAAGELVTMERHLEILSSAHAPIVQRLDALPFEVASRCNPSDPQMAIDALLRWVADLKPQIRAALPKAK